MNLLIENVSDLNDMIMQGKTRQAFEKFYHKDVVIQYNDEEPIIGKEANRKLKETDLKNIVELKCAKPLKVTIGEQVTMVEWQFQDQHKVFGERKFTQVAVHDWNQGLVIKEKLYCGNKQK